MGRHKSRAQEAIMVNFMQKHTDLASGMISDKRHRNNLWTLLTNRLNTRGPPRKSPERWKKVWVDWRSSIKRKIIQEKNEAAASDQLHSRKTFLSPTEYELAHICGFLEKDEDGYVQYLNDDTYYDGSVASIGDVETANESISQMNTYLDSDADVHATSKKEDFTKHYSTGIAVIKEELILDDTDNEMPMDSDAGSTNCDLTERNNSETECLTVEHFAICDITPKEIKHEIEDSDVERQLKDRRSTNSTEKVKRFKVESDEGLVSLITQQTILMQTVTELIKENAKGQTESLRVMKDIRHGLKDMSESIKKLNEATAEQLKEQRRHNYEIEKLRREEMLLKKQQLELNELEMFKKA
ncbi:uncharacterized protein LOC105215061 [Zeugodacus cucurbitae]|uniref:Regulatory protein zeste n=1 Tax=Zeugodacus cucurbitae TaxID=28588 RepID=A0A0A1WCW8_ZEUCU|nr:uncharacterized protein LOC105215061 [Zeugodacus cucurbitae]